jgi:alpha-1,3/alpha-1,6-mannosyltransferase
MLHPQMGIGGAERLTLDAARGLAELGHRPVIFTREMSRDRAFEAAHDGSVDLRVHPTRIPSTFGGRLKAPLSVARMATLAAALRVERGNFDVAYLDLVAHAAPVLRRSLRLPVLFYCHYPDYLLAPRRSGLFGLYRRPIDGLERRGLLAASQVVVNSKFTSSVYGRVFPDLPPPQVVYPGIEIGPLPKNEDADRGEIVLLSINRFTIAKNLPLAVKALGKLRSLLAPEEFSRLRLVLAGGFDSTLEESRRVREAIEGAAHDAGVAAQVSTVLNPADAECRDWLNRCRCLIYTPENEHFGLGPIEAMAAGKPVVAVSSGGPAETIQDERSGRLRPALPEAFAAAIAPWVRAPGEARAMGKFGRGLVEERFSRGRFARDLEGILQGLAVRKEA